MEIMLFLPIDPIHRKDVKKTVFEDTILIITPNI